ncbi:hypothetical protein [Pikeienuella sp. HZG-20]|uniref:hypothetical protein n=1 Tax=Paludibacillus litoralis TaxID=3133267 RepID=UPI0030EB60F0
MSALHEYEWVDLGGGRSRYLQSGVIEQIYGSNLSPEQRLSEAYRMTGGRPPSQSASEADPEPVAPPMPRPVDPDGGKSISGAPTSGKTVGGKRQFTTARDAIKAAFADSP